jgi:hypothetical protein
MNDKEGFTEWTGGPCPIDESAYVEVTYRNGEKYTGYAGIHDWNWLEEDADLDITSYRILDGAR